MTSMLLMLRCAKFNGSQVNSIAVLTFSLKKCKCQRRSGAEGKGGISRSPIMGTLIGRCGVVWWCRSWLCQEKTPAASFRFSDITNGRCLMMGRQREAFNYKDNRCSKVASLASLCVI